jgi:hypothetical protein
MIVSEVMPPPDHHDDPTTQYETWFLLGRQSPTAALSIQFGQVGPPSPLNPKAPGPDLLVRAKDLLERRQSHAIGARICEAVPFEEGERWRGNSVYLLAATPSA